MKLPYPNDGFQHALRSLPSPGGNGYHTALLGVANRGIIAGVDHAELFRLIRAHTPKGSRIVPDHEIRDAVTKAAKDCAANGARREAMFNDARVNAEPRRFDPGIMLRGILEKGGGAKECDLWEHSPIRIEWEAQREASEFLRAMYAPAEILFIGALHDSRQDRIRAAGAWAAQFEAGTVVPEHIAPNPMTGEVGMTKNGRQSFRADACVAHFRYAVLEFDTTPEPLLDSAKARGPWPREEQVKFWAGALAYRWPIAALIDSGGKSIHGWMAVGARNADDWTANVENGLFAHWLVPCGVDRACRNESRLSRMPGHSRIETGRRQRLLYLNPKAGEVTS